MSKKHPRRSSSSAGNGGTNEPGDDTAQPSAAEQAEGVVTSSADPRPASDHGRRLDTIEKQLAQLAIKVGL